MAKSHPFLEMKIPTKVTPSKLCIGVTLYEIDL